MFAHKHYVPVLKCKSGDLWSLGALHAGSEASITPVIEMVPPTEKKTELGRLQEAVAGIEKNWGAKRFFADLIWRRDLLPLPAPDGRHIVTAFFDLARARGLHAIPVTSPDRNPAFQNAVARVVAQDHCGLAVRLAPAHFNDPAILTPALNGILALMGVGRDEVDLMLDFGHIGAINAAFVPALMRTAISNVPHIQDWRTLTVVSGTFPPALNVLNQGVWNTLTRVEWTAWRTVVTGATPPARLPSYGDFAVGDPGLPYVGYAKYAVNLRYSAGDDFFVWRGHVAATHPAGNGQIYTVCADLVGRPQYAGPNFSEGDRQIQLKSAMIGSTGNADSWRRWATNHYLELVVSQLATLP